MDLHIQFLRWFNSKNKVLKPYQTVFNLSRDSFTQENNVIALFAEGTLVWSNFPVLFLFTSLS